MSHITETGRQRIAEIAGRYGLSQGAVEEMARAVARGGGTMAQFSIPELGGAGQWMAGGMTMVGDMFNTGLQATVVNLCGELSNAMMQEQFFAAPATGPGASSWWPAELGQPASVGGQNEVRYAYFPGARRIAFDTGRGPVILLDTLDHQIGGFSQQQSGIGGDPFAGVTFSSQYGQFAVSSLPRVGEPGAQAQPEPIVEPVVESVQESVAEPAPVADPAPAPVATPEAAPAPPAPSAGRADAGDILNLIERLAALRDAGALSEEEFSAKKTELLARL